MRRKTLSEIRGYLFSIAIFVIVFVSFIITLRMTEVNSSERWLQTKKDAVVKAVVSCYAIEGEYPPNIDYLREHYGLQVEDSRYRIHYVIFGSNMMPEIDVLKK